MPTLKQVAQLEYDRIFPNSDDDTSLTIHDFVETARQEYSFLAWRMYLEEKRMDGESEVSSNIQATAKVEIKNGEIDISSLNILRALPGDVWLRELSPANGTFVKTTSNNRKLIDDEDIGGGTRFYVEGDKIKFTSKVADQPATMVYASNNVDGSDNIDEKMASLIRAKLREIYDQPMPENKTSDNNPNA